MNSNPPENRPVDSSIPVNPPKKDGIPTYAEHTRLSATVQKELLQLFREFSAQFMARLESSSEQLSQTSKAESARHKTSLRRMGELEYKVDTLTKLLNDSR
jgi:hypothetical protein